MTADPIFGKRPGVRLRGGPTRLGRGYWSVELWLNGERTPSTSFDDRRAAAACARRIAKEHDTIVVQSDPIVLEGVDVPF